MSGLKLLNTVLPLNEAIVFQCQDFEFFQTVARLKGTNITQDRERPKRSLARRHQAM